MEAIILAGGLGSRLKSIVSDIPKPMAPVNGRPFLSYVLDDLAFQGVTRVVLSVGYRREVIMKCFGQKYQGMQLDYAVENAPLGTGGGIRLAMDMVSSSTPLILNGDTYFSVNLSKLLTSHQESGAKLTIALKPMERFDRYGVITIDEAGAISMFSDKGYHEFGLINGGIYVASKELFSGFFLKKQFSFETFIHKHIDELSASGFVSDGYFIDIGVPEDYERAQFEMAKIKCLDHTWISDSGCELDD